MDKTRLHKVIWNKLEQLNISTTAGSVMSLTEAVLEFDAAEQRAYANVCHTSPTKNHVWGTGSRGVICIHCAAKRH